MKPALAALAVLLCAAPATAAEDIPPPNEVRFIDVDDASSGCIGDPGTPLCAVETYMACDVRADPEICFSAGLPRKRGWIAFPGRGRVVYSVVDVVRPPEVEVSSAPLPPIAIILVESNTYFGDGFYLDNEFVVRAPHVLTRYKVELQGEKWQVAERAECLRKTWKHCGAAKQ